MPPPTDNLTAVLTTSKANLSAPSSAELLAKFGASGVLSFSDDQAVRSQMAGRAMFRTQPLIWLVPLDRHDESTVKSNVRYSLSPFVVAIIWKVLDTPDISALH